jgi:short subunit dehydrogenase-like uncharacterized protein
VDACTDYVDITGEPAFWWRIIERYHDRAAERGVLIVPCCGFDSIPHDMGVLFTLGALGANDAPVRIRGYVSVTGRPSGGTWSSAVHAMTGLRTMKRARPARTSQPHERPRVHRVPELERWAVPLPTIDPLVVKRSAEFSPAFPEAFTYLHYLQTRSVWSVGKLAAGAGVVAGLAQWKPTRDLLLRMQPSGTGPSAEERARGRFRVTFLAEAGGKRLRTQVSGHDPGYEHTSKMLAAAALTLVEDRDALPHRGGVLTPASALAGPLMPRLADTGMRFDIQDR